MLLSLLSSPINFVFVVRHYYPAFNWVIFNHKVTVVNLLVKKAALRVPEKESL